MSTELVSTDIQNTMALIEQTAKDYGIMTLEGKNEMEKTFILATGMCKLKELLTDEIMQPILYLQNTALGFKTDKKEGYPKEVVRDVTAEALLRGLRMVGNEVNIIASNFYAAKDGCKRLVIEWPGLTEFDHRMSFPRDEGGKAYVDFLATWKLNGTEQYLEKKGATALSIRRNAGMIDDAILGKAERKMYAAILSKLSNFTMPEGDLGDDEHGTVIPAKVQRSSLNDFDKLPEQEKKTFDPVEQATIVSDYKTRISSSIPMAISGIQKEAATSGMLSSESLAEINRFANEQRRKK